MKKQQQRTHIAAAILAVLIILQAAPSSFNLLAYDRDAILVQDQYWRLLTAPVVHYNWMHCLSNAIAVATALWLLPASQLTRLCWLYISTTLMTSVWLLIWDSNIGFFTGISAYAVALWAYLLLNLIETGRDSKLATTLLLLLLAKIILEACDIQLMQHTGFQSLWQAHAIGMGAAILFFFAARCSTLPGS